jgi:hypothetical protein
LAHPAFLDRASRTRACQAAHPVLGNQVAGFRAEQAVAQAPDPDLVQQTVELARMAQAWPVEQAVVEAPDLVLETEESQVRVQVGLAAKLNPAPAEGVGKVPCVNLMHQGRIHPVAGRVPLPAFERLDLPVAGLGPWPWKQG